jgi:crotonobetainyl-CoA:carnitine CoA-transferase CaiB-like acyl-CoA transferase
LDSVFKGLKVIDFTWAITGPLVTKYLADFGATVIKVESPLHPDVTRVSAPYKDRIPGINRSGYFVLYNSNKYSISLNLSNPQGMEIIRRLIKWSDVVAESFTPGVMERYGLGYENLKQIKPDIIMFRTSIHGETGPFAKQPGLGYQIGGFVGFPLLVGWPDRSPLPVPVAYTDYIAFQFGAAALIAALERRRRTGEGLCLDLSQVESSLHFLSPVIMDYVVNSRMPIRVGNSASDAAPHGVYRCQGDDEWCAISVSSDRQWLALVEAMGNPSWAAEPAFGHFLGRKQNEDALNKLIEAWTVNFSADDVMKRLQSVGVPCGVVAKGEWLINNPQLKERGYYRELEHTEMGKVLASAQPFAMSKTPAELRMPAPCLGEHSEFVCKEILGMSDEEFVECFASGCFE